MRTNVDPCRPVGSGAEWEAVSIRPDGLTRALSYQKKRLRSPHQKSINYNYQDLKKINRYDGPNPQWSFVDARSNVARVGRDRETLFQSTIVVTTSLLTLESNPRSTRICKPNLKLRRKKDRVSLVCPLARSPIMREEGDSASFVGEGGYGGGWERRWPNCLGLFMQQQICTANK